jgi:hypothetical protein
MVLGMVEWPWCSILPNMGNYYIRYKSYKLSQGALGVTVVLYDEFHKLAHEANFKKVPPFCNNLAVLYSDLIQIFVYRNTVSCSTVQ